MLDAIIAFEGLAHRFDTFGFGKTVSRLMIYDPRDSKENNAELEALFLELIEIEGMLFSSYIAYETGRTKPENINTTLFKSQCFTNVQRKVHELKNRMYEIERVYQERLYLG